MYAFLYPPSTPNYSLLLSAIYTRILTSSLIPIPPLPSISHHTRVTIAVFSHQTILCQCLPFLTTHILPLPLFHCHHTIPLSYFAGYPQPTITFLYSPSKTYHCLPFTTSPTHPLSPLSTPSTPHHCLLSLPSTNDHYLRFCLPTPNHCLPFSVHPHPIIAFLSPTTTGHHCNSFPSYLHKQIQHTLDRLALSKTCSFMTVYYTKSYISVLDNAAVMLFAEV